MWQKLLFMLAPIVVKEACEYYRERAKREEDKRISEIELRIAQLEVKVNKENT
jgi:hypothetical protein